MKVGDRVKPKSGATFAQAGRRGRLLALLPGGIAEVIWDGDGKPRRAASLALEVVE